MRAISSFVLAPVTVARWFGHGVLSGGRPARAGAPVELRAGLAVQDHITGIPVSALRWFVDDVARRLRRWAGITPVDQAFLAYTPASAPIPRTAKSNWSPCRIQSNPKVSLTPSSVAT